MPLREETTIRIGHLTGTGFDVLSTERKRRYTVTTRRIRRPATGKALVELHCDRCGAALLVRVRSRALSRTIRKRYKLTAFIGAVSAVVLYGGAVGLDQAGVVLPFTSVLGPVSVIAFLLGLAAFAVGMYASYNEEGIRLRSGPGVADGTHRLLLGDLHDPPRRTLVS
ncbi:hypothetical protein AB0K52_10850 [Glycomyces sp. NPDC049804]|uniref:hypothetical protein n=1 Tax=Glycomyces sp. NPDC049804 TaxID=3154363 RepID=UPI00343DCB55